jgi:hydroxyethylthiazole kinase-like uncharacterized protein yjeF
MPNRPKNPGKALTCKAVRELDRAAIEDYGIPSLLLMENAGRACAELGHKLLVSRPTARPAVVLVGPGNNGGDGFVIARTLFNRGHEVHLFFVGSLAILPNLSEDVQVNERLWCELEPMVTAVQEVQMGSLQILEAALQASPGLVVDCLFGTGLSRDLEDPWLAVVGLVHQYCAGKIPVLAADIPSGLHGDLGTVMGDSIVADHTVTFVAPKPGLLRGAGPERAGEIHVAEIGIPRGLVERAHEQVQAATGDLHG